jgi:hypothetical protein
MQMQMQCSVVRAQPGGSHGRETTTNLREIHTNHYWLATKIRLRFQGTPSAKWKGCKKRPQEMEPKIKEAAAVAFSRLLRNDGRVTTARPPTFANPSRGVHTCRVNSTGWLVRKRHDNTSQAMQFDMRSTI